MKNIRIVLACSMLLQVALIASALIHGSSHTIRKPRLFEGCAPNPAPDSCIYPDPTPCSSCHTNMGRK